MRASLPDAGGRAPRARGRAERCGAGDPNEYPVAGTTGAAVADAAAAGASPSAETGAGAVAAAEDAGAAEGAGAAWAAASAGRMADGTIIANAATKRAMI